MSQDNPFLRRLARRLAVDPHDEAFLYDVIASPQDEVALTVYFDWLLDRGDPRGQYVHLRRDQDRGGINAGEWSRLQRLRDELRERIDRLWLGLVLREPIRGTVTRIEDDGFWVDLGGVEGEVHVCDCSWC